MRAQSNSAYPVASLQRFTQELEATITLCLADPRPKAVHKLRTTTRRIEAQIILLAILPGIPEHSKQADKVLRRMRKLRKAVGRVRDLDVQIDSLEDTEAWPKTSNLQADKVLRKDARHLARELKRRRRHEAVALQAVLQDAQARLTRSLERLLGVLEPSQSLNIPSARLVQTVRVWFEHAVPELDDDPGDDRLHEIRKAAKAARYLLESAPESARSARTLASRFEALQQAGGHWHDLLTLAEEARKHLPHRSPLTESVVREHLQSRVSYRAQLEKVHRWAVPTARTHAAKS